MVLDAPNQCQAPGNLDGSQDMHGESQDNAWCNCTFQDHFPSEGEQWSRSWKIISTALVVKHIQYPQASVRERWTCIALSYHKRQEKGPSGLSNSPERTRKVRSKLNWWEGKQASWTHWYLCMDISYHIIAERSYYPDKIKWREPDTLPTPNGTGEVSNSWMCSVLRTGRNYINLWNENTQQASTEIQGSLLGQN